MYSQTVMDHFKGPKLIVFKYSPKKRIRVKSGHRQQYTRLMVDVIGKPGETRKAPKAEKAAPKEEQAEKKIEKKEASALAVKEKKAEKAPAKKTEKAPAKKTTPKKTPAKKASSTKKTEK